MITVDEQKGTGKAKQEDLIPLLERSFGKLTAAHRRKIRQIDSTERLDALLLALLDAKSLDELELELE